MTQKRKQPDYDESRNVSPKDINSILKRNSISPKCWYFSPSGQIVWWQYINKNSKSAHRSDILKYKCVIKNTTYIVDDSNNIFVLLERYKFVNFQMPYILENLENINFKKLLILINGNYNKY